MDISACPHLHPVEGSLLLMTLLPFLGQDFTNQILKTFAKVGCPFQRTFPQGGNRTRPI